MAFYPSVFLSVSSNIHYERRPWDTDYKCYFSVIKDIDYKDKVFRLSVFSSVSLKYHFQRRPWDIDYKDMSLHLSVF